MPHIPHDDSTGSKEPPPRLKIVPTPPQQVHVRISIGPRERLTIASTVIGIVVAAATGIAAIVGWFVLAQLAIEVI